MQDEIQRVEYATKYDLNRLDKRLTNEIDENRKEISRYSNEITRLQAMYKTLEELPGTFHKLDKTLTLVGANMESLERKMTDLQESVNNQNQAIMALQKNDDEQDSEIRRVDNKGKVDWIEAITKNFWKILATLGTVYAIVYSILYLN